MSYESLVMSSLLTFSFIVFYSFIWMLVNIGVQDSVVTRNEEMSGGLVNVIVTQPPSSQRWKRKIRQ